MPDGLEVKLERSVTHRKILTKEIDVACGDVRSLAPKRQKPPCKVALSKLCEISLAGGLDVASSSRCVCVNLRQ
jgi:hypothetical protein